MIKVFRTVWRGLCLIIIILTLSLKLSASSCSAADVESIMQKMKEATEPQHPSIQKIIITRSERGEKAQNVVLQAFKKLADGKYRLMIVLQPADIKGMAFLARESTTKKPDIMWIYLPDINRVREILGLGQYDSFLGTLFTYADLGFVKLHGTYALLGEEQYEGKKAYRVQELPLQQDYYSRIVSWIAADSMLLLKRDFYSAGGQLWKAEFFEDFTIIDGIKTPIRILMSLVNGRTSTELKLAEINYDVNIPDELFDPNRLSTVATHPFWKSYRPRPVAKQ
jgi:hypothetical protein